MGRGCTVAVPTGMIPPLNQGKDGYNYKAYCHWISNNADSIRHLLRIPQRHPHTRYHIHPQSQKQHLAYTYQTPPSTTTRLSTAKMSDVAGKERNTYYAYDPSLMAAVVFTLLFIASSGYHMWQIWRLRSWYFVPFLVGCFREFPLPALFLRQFSSYH
jgi:hypothetical protein